MPQQRTGEAQGFSSSKLSVLRKHPYFADLEPEAFDQLCRYAKHSMLKRGATIFSKGDPGISLFAVISGTVKISISSPDGRNAILITHGYTSTHHAAGRNPANGNLPGWWDGLIGPGKAIDTDKLFVVSSNMLGSSSGSTNGASINPQTGKPYGPDFPAITVRDIVTVEKALLDCSGSSI